MARAGLNVLDPGETVLVATVEDREIRILGEALIAVASIGAGIVFSAVFLGDKGGWDTLITIGVVLTPLLLTAAFRKKTRAIFTDRRILVWAGDDAPDSLRYDTIERCRRWGTNLVLTNRDNKTIVLPNMRALYLLEHIVLQRMRP